MLTCGGCVCISNNPYIKDKVSSFEYVDGSALDVLYAARDAVHLGGVLASDPLYGNFKPNQQPYRTAVVYKNTAHESNEWSLSLLENAIKIYENAPVTARRGARSMKIDRDLQLIDFELMKETLRQYSLIKE